MTAHDSVGNTVLQMHNCVFSLSQTFYALLLLTASEKVNDVFGVGHAVHKLLAETRSVERLKASAVVNLRKTQRRTSTIVALVSIKEYRHCRSTAPYPQANERFLWGEWTSKSFPFGFLYHLCDLHDERWKENDKDIHRGA